jgi:hypothetical protein
VDDVSAVGEPPAVRPRWWKLVLLPSWIGHSLELFAVLLLPGFPLALETRHSSTRWTIFAVALVFSVGYGLYASRRIHRTVIASDDASYTIRLEWIRRGVRRPP